MARVRHSNLESTDASRSDDLPLVSLGAPPCPESCRNRAALDSIPTLDTGSKDGPNNTAIFKDSRCWQEGKRNTSLTTSDFCSYNTEGDKVDEVLLLSPHTTEEQRYMWYHSSPAIAEEQVANGRNMKSTSISRSQSSHSAAEPQSTKNDRGSKGDMKSPSRCDLEDGGTK
jgi:hypothetical protein